MFPSFCMVLTAVEHLPSYMVSSYFSSFLPRNCWSGEIQVSVKFRLFIDGGEVLLFEIGSHSVTQAGLYLTFVAQSGLRLVAILLPSFH